MPSLYMPSSSAQIQPVQPVQPVQLIALDLDGTLLGPDGQISPRNRAALLAAEAAGTTIVIATGRRHGYALRVLHPAGLRADTLLLSSNGTVVRTLAHRLVERTLMQPAAVRLLLGTLGEFRNALVVTFDRVNPDGEDAHDTLIVEELADLQTSIERWMAANEPYMQHVQPIERAFDGGDLPIQMMLCGTVERMRRAEALMLGHDEVAAVAEPSGKPDTAKLIQLSRTEYPDRDLSLVDIIPAGCSKGAALVRVAAAQGIRPEQIMAIGDNWNDVSMLECTGHPVLMGNAPADLQLYAAERGWRRAQPNDQDGVAAVIEAELAAPLLTAEAVATS